MNEIKIHLAFSDQGVALDRAIKQTLALNDHLSFVDTPGEADLVIFSEVRMVERDFDKKKSYIHISPRDREQNLPENVVVIPPNAPSVLKQLVQEIEKVGEELKNSSRSETATARETDKGTVPVQPNAKRILVIDDKPEHRASATKGLAGHHLTATSSYDEAMEILGKENFDVVLTDLHLPMSSRTLSPQAFKLGEEVPYGLLLMIEAARRGAKLVAVVTDLGHHDDPFSAAFDHFSRLPITIEGARVRMLHARITGGGKDWAYALETLEHETD